MTRKTKEVNLNVRAALEVFIALYQFSQHPPIPPPFHLRSMSKANLQTLTKEFQTLMEIQSSLYLVHAANFQRASLAVGQKNKGNNKKS